MLELILDFAKMKQNWAQNCEIKVIADLHKFKLLFKDQCPNDLQYSSNLCNIWFSMNFIKS